MSNELTSNNITDQKYTHSIQNVSSTPTYISDFIGIYKENKMDVMFLNENNLLMFLSKDSWNDIKHSRGEKKLLICQDCDINAIFLIFL
jgi:hypothetical protein